MSCVMRVTFGFFWRGSVDDGSMALFQFAPRGVGEGSGKRGFFFGSLDEVCRNFGEKGVG